MSGKPGTETSIPIFCEKSRVSAPNGFMPRMARAVAVGVPHHVTQRGNNRQRIFDSEQDRFLYLKLSCGSIPRGACCVCGDIA